MNGDTNKSQYLLDERRRSSGDSEEGPETHLMVRVLDRALGRRDRDRGGLVISATFKMERVSTSTRL